jgi:alkylation response protein AidB-like acyl-CoA dehydrogenase
MTAAIGLDEFADEVRTFFVENWPPPGEEPNLSEDNSRGVEISKRFHRVLGEKGWLSLSWPEEFGGAGMSVLFEYVLAQEVAYLNSPYPAYPTGPLPYVATQIVAPVLMQHGTVEQQQRFLSGIRTGEMDFALGYSETEAGTDLANVRVRADREEGGWRVNGVKMWTSAGHKAEFCWTLVRAVAGSTGKDGLALMIIDLSAPGVTINAISILDDTRTNEMVLDGVFVPDSQLIGEPDQGWRYLTESLGFERLVAFPPSRNRGPYDRLRDDLAGSSEPVADDTARLIGEIAVDLAVSDSVSDLAVLDLQGSADQRWLQALSKVQTSETMQRLAAAGQRVYGMRGSLRDTGDSGVVEEFERMHRSAIMRTFGGGTNDVLRAIVCGGQR